MKFSYKELILFSLPTILGTLLEPMAGIIDTALVGQVSSDWLAALGLATTMLTSFFWIFNFLVHAGTSHIAQANASNDEETVGQLIFINLMMALGLGLACSGVLWIGKEFFFSLVGVSPELYAPVNEYYMIRLWGIPFGILMSALTGIFRGLKFIRSLTFIFFMITLCNALLTYSLIYHFHFGLQGAAVATIAAQILGSLTTIILLMSCQGGKYFKLVKKSKKLVLAQWLNMGRDSLSIFMRSGSLTLCFFLCTSTASRLGTIPLATHQVILQFWMLVSFITDGIAITANIFCAEQVALKNAKAFKAVTLKTLNLGFIIGVFFCLIFLIFQDQLWDIFTQDRDVLAELGQVWLLIAIVQVPNSFAYVFDGVLFGTKSFSYLSRHMIFGLFFIVVPTLVMAHFYFETLWSIWMALVMLNFYRITANSIKTRQILASHFQ